MCIARWMELNIPAVRPRRIRHPLLKGVRDVAFMRNDDNVIARGQISKPEISVLVGRRFESKFWSPNDDPNQGTPVRVIGDCAAQFGGRDGQNTGEENQDEK